MHWWDAHPMLELFITTITQAEILLGIELLPAGQLRTALLIAAEATFDQDFDNRILAFDTDAAREFAGVVAGRRKIGRPISQSDAQIAAIARSHGASVPTRNTGDFENCGVTVMDPWA